MKKKLLVCCTDAGGAANIAPIVDYIDKKNIFSFTILTNDYTKKYFINYKKNHSKYLINSSKDATKILLLEKPNIILCGTTRFFDSPENLLIREAQKLNIKSLAIIDEWYNYKKRFADGKNNFCYPDFIALNDDLAKKEAIQEGIPEEKCFITGSPSLTSINKKYLSFIDCCPIPPDFIIKSNLVITLLSETHSKDFGERYGESGVSGDYLGYSEKTVINDILKSLINLNINNKISFIEKLHPSDQNKFNKKLISKNITHIQIRDCDLASLLWYSHIIIGMTSISLIEASFLERSIASYQPNLIGINYCTANRLKLVDIGSISISIFSDLLLL